MLFTQFFVLAFLFGVFDTSTADPLPPYVVPRVCPAFESWKECGPNCQTECATLNDPCLIDYVRCPDACYCNDGYARDANRRCIPIAQCPPKKGNGKEN